MSSFNDLAVDRQSWKMENDEKLYTKINEFGNDFGSSLSRISQLVKDLNTDVAHTSTNLQNAVNSFMLLSMTKFVENSVEEPVPKEDAPIDRNPNDEETALSRMQKALSIAISDLKINSDANDEMISVPDSEMTQVGNPKITSIKLPSIIATKEFFDSEFVGLVNIKRQFSPSSNEFAQPLTSNQINGLGSGSVILESPDEDRKVSMTSVANIMPAEPRNNPPLNGAPPQNSQPPLLGSVPPPPDPRLMQNFLDAEKKKEKQSDMSNYEDASLKTSPRQEQPIQHQEQKTIKLQATEKYDESDSSRAGSDAYESGLFNTRNTNWKEKQAAGTGLFAAPALTANKKNLFDKEEEEKSQPALFGSRPAAKAEPPKEEAKKKTIDMLFASSDEEESLDMLRSKKKEPEPVKATAKTSPPKRDRDFDSDDDYKNKESVTKTSPSIVQQKKKPAFMESDEEDDTRKMSVLSNSSFNRQLVHGRDPLKVSSAVEALRGKIGSIKLTTPEQQEKVRSTSKSARGTILKEGSVVSSDSFNNDLLLGKATVNKQSKKAKKKGNFFNDSDEGSDDEFAKKKEKSPPVKADPKKASLFEDSQADEPKEAREPKPVPNLSSQDAKAAAAKRLQELFPDDDLDDY